MIFANPQILHLLWLLPLVALSLHLFYYHRCKIMSRFIQEHLINDLAQGFSRNLYRLKAVFLMAAFVCMVVAMARPQWGFSIRPVSRHGTDIMVVIDTSKSMLTQDVKPSRLERSKLAVKDLVMKLNGSDYIGLIAFAGEAMVMCPLTYDYNGFLLSLDDLSVDSIPRGSSNMSRAIDEAVKAYEGMTDSDKAVVLITDGEEEDGNALESARKAREKGVRIFTVGVGTKEGDLIQAANADGQTSFVKDADGNVIKSRLNENLLQQIAYITGGTYIRSGAAQFGLDYLYDRQLSKLKKRDKQEKETRQYHERYQWLLTFAFLFLLIEFFLPLFFLKRPAVSLRQAGYKICKRINTGQGGVLFFFIVFLISSPTFASTAAKVNKANDLYKQGKLDDSLKLYEEALSRDGKSSIIKYNFGTALYKKGDYTKALEYLQQATSDKNFKIKYKAEYNLGNVLYKSGIQKENTNVDEAIKSLQEALGRYEEVIAQDPQDKDAAFNQDFVKKEIERLKQKKQQQEQKKQQQQDQKQQDEKKEQQNQQSEEDQKNQSQQNQEKKEEQQSKQEDSKDQGQKSSQEQAAESQQDLERKQAENLLEEYQQNEEPKKLLNFMFKKINDKPVLKDW